MLQIAMCRSISRSLCTKARAAPLLIGKRFEFFNSNSMVFNEEEFYYSIVVDVVSIYVQVHTHICYSFK